MPAERPSWFLAALKGESEAPDDEETDTETEPSWFTAAVHAKRRPSRRFPIFDNNDQPPPAA